MSEVPDARDSARVPPTGPASGAGPARPDQSAATPRSATRRLLTILAIVAAAVPWAWATPPVALAAGLILALAGLAEYQGFAKRGSRTLIQIGVVLLGFKMDLRTVLQAGLVGLAFAAGTILVTFALGAAFGRLLGVDRKVTTLLSSGTAICGGSAIAATGSVIAASQAQISVAIGTVFVLNAIGLYIFPPLGQWLGLSAAQFGTWAAVAVHDISSVVGSAHVFDSVQKTGDAALQTATAVKLSRALWIAPVAFFAAWAHRRIDRRETAGAAAGPAKIPIPWFIGLFLLAAVARTAFPAIAAVAPALEAAGKQALTVALLLIGLGLSRKAIASVGWRPMLLGVLLWIAISVLALAVVRQTIPHAAGGSAVTPHQARS